MLTLQGHFTELVSKRNEVSPVKSVLQCQSVQKAMSSGGSEITEVMARP